MPLEFGNVVNSCASFVAGNKFIGKVLGNPLFTALLVTALAMIILWVLYKEELKDTGKKRALRTFIYIAFATTALLFVHFYIVRKSLECEVQRQGINQVFQSIQTSAEMKGREGARQIIEGAGLSSPPKPVQIIGAAEPENTTELPDNIEPTEGFEFEEVVLERPKAAEIPKKA